MFANFVFSRKTTLGFINLFHSLFSLLFIFDLIFSSCVLPTPDLAFPSLFSSLRCNVRLFTWDLSSFLMWTWLSSASFPSCLCWIPWVLVSCVLFLFVEGVFKFPAWFLAGPMVLVLIFTYLYVFPFSFRFCLFVCFLHHARESTWWYFSLLNLRRLALWFNN